MASEEQSIIVESSSEGITVISINRPHRKNAVDFATGEKLYDAIIAFETDASQKVAILTGTGGTFCAGADLHQVAQRQEGDAQSDDRLGGLTSVKDRNRGPMGPSRLVVKKPLTCAVAGHAVAGGLELSLLGDMRVVEEDAVFGVFCRRWGVPLIDGGTVRLQTIVGLGRALDMILTGRPVDAKEALTMGLANRIVPRGESLKEAMRIARELLTFPQLCMNIDRNACYDSSYNASSLQDALANEWNNGYEVVPKEGVAGAARFSKGSGRHASFAEFSKL